MIFSSRGGNMAVRRAVGSRFFLFWSLVRFDDRLQIGHRWTIAGVERGTKGISGQRGVTCSRAGLVSVIELGLSLEKRSSADQSRQKRRDLTELFN